jgi:predicted Rossmann fold flavoprotein
MAAGAAAKAAPALRIAALERNQTPGKKLSITGKGRCNITNNAEKEQFMRNIPGNGKFLFSAFHTLPNTAIVAFFERIGVGCVLERGGRYFTRSGDAKQVTEALCRHAASSGAKLLCGARLEAIERATDAAPAIGRDADLFRLLLSDGRRITARAVILATGGISYPATGSTGDGYRFAESLGHTVVPPRPSLVPLETVEDWPRTLMGLTLKNVTLELFTPGGKRCFSKLGEMLFTHFGISGPLVLSGSRHLLDCGFSGSAARIDLKPGLSDEKLRARIGRDFELYAKKRLKNAMSDLLPTRLIPVVIACGGLDPEGRADAVGKAGRAKLSEILKNLPLTIRAARPASEAIVTAGGVKTSEINPSTMESKRMPGLYFCGELIDVDAYTGGFNLSIAFATGMLAGKSAAAALLRD